MDGFDVGFIYGEKLCKASTDTSETYTHERTSASKYRRELKNFLVTNMHNKYRDNLFLVQSSGHEHKDNNPYVKCT